MKKNDNRPLKEYAAPTIRGLSGGIVRLAVGNNNFVIPNELLKIFI